MIKRPLPKGKFDIVIGDRYVVDGDSFKYEAHIYLERGNEMHGGIGKTPEEALFNAIVHWRKAKEK